MAEEVTFSKIEGIEFSKADREFIAAMADRNELLDHFLILFGISVIVGGASGVSIKSGTDLAAYLSSHAVNVSTSGWDEFFQGVLLILTSTMIRDIQIHIHQKNPKGNARKFFQDWLNYFADLRNRAK